jgi:hypothetical protein
MCVVSIDIADVSIVVVAAVSVVAESAFASLFSPLLHAAKPTTAMIANNFFIVFVLVNGRKDNIQNEISKCPLSAIFF